MQALLFVLSIHTYYAWVESMPFCGVPSGKTTPGLIKALFSLKCMLVALVMPSSPGNIIKKAGYPSGPSYVSKSNFIYIPHLWLRSKAPRCGIYLI